MEKFQIEWVPIASIKLNSKNRNRHPPEQIDRLAKNFEALGWIGNPIVVSTRSGLCAAGEGRYLAAKKCKMKEVPVHFKAFAREEDEYAFGISDNALADWADLDMSAINADLPDLGPDCDLELLGIKDLTLDPSEKYQDQDADAVPEVTEEPISKPGDLWILGEHRVLCGDCTDKANIERLMGGEKADMVFTDPPYNLQERGQLKRTNKTASKTQKFGDWDVGFNPKSVLPLLRENTFTDAHLFVCTSSYLFGQIHEYFEQCGDKPNYIVWVKNNPMPSLSKKSFVQSTELIVHSRKGEPEFKYPSGKNLPNVILGNVEPHEFGHPTQKPIYMIQYCLGPTKGSVLDLFLGSGSTLIACEKTGRRCFGMEIDCHYTDIVVKRWETFTGKKAHLEKVVTRKKG